MRLLSFWLLLCTVLAVQAATPRVFRDRVRPEWLEGGDRFWYRVAIGPEAWEYVLVDATSGVRQTAFDHSRLAERLRQEGLTNAAATSLNLSRLRFGSGNTVHFQAGGRSWSYDLAANELQPGSAPTNAPAAPPATADASRSTGGETQITILNRTSDRVSLFWLDTEGTPRAYGTIDAGASRDQHTFAGHIWSVRGEGGKEISRLEAEESPVTWEVNGESKPPARRERRERGARSSASPDGQWKIESRDYNLLLVGATGQPVLTLTTNGSADYRYSTAVRWAPDSRKLIAFGTPYIEERQVHLIESAPADQLQPKLHTINYAKPGDPIAVGQPHLFQVPEAKEIPLTNALFTEPWSLTDFRWAKDSSRFTFLYNARGHQTLRVIAVDAQSGAARAIVEERSPTFIDYAGKYFCHYLESPAEIIWMSERDGWNHLWLYDAVTGEVRNQITRGEWVVREVERVDPERREIWFWAGGIVSGQDPYYRHLCRVNFDGSGLRVLTEGDGSHSAQFSPDRRFFIDTWSRVDAPPVNQLRRAEDGKLLCALEQADISGLQASGWRPPTRFSAPGRDDRTPIEGIIHWPRDYDPAGKYPVIESIYAGPHGAFVPKTFQASYPARSLADLGFVVVQIDGMGTSQRSKAFHDVCWKNLGDSGFPDRIRWMQAAARAYPALDLSRVGIYGTSAGGQSALRALLAYGDFYQAAVADSGCHDNRMDKIWWNELWMGWPVGPHYAEQSNVTQARKLKGHLLLLAGELDRNVDPASTMQVADALIKAGKDFDLLVVPGQGHGVIGIPYVRERMQAFFVRWLQPSAKP